MITCLILSLDLSSFDNWMMWCREMVVVHPDVDFLDDITGQLGKVSDFNNLFLFWLLSMLFTAPLPIWHGQLSCDAFPKEISHTLDIPSIAVTIICALASTKERLEVLFTGVVLLWFYWMQYVCEELNVRAIVPWNDPLQYASLRAEPDYRCYSILEFAQHCSLCWRWCSETLLMSFTGLSLQSFLLYLFWSVWTWPNICLVTSHFSAELLQFSQYALYLLQLECGYYWLFLLAASLDCLPTSWLSLSVHSRNTTETPDADVV
jgi:hypothetical protein